MKDNETIRINFDRGLYTYNIYSKVLKQLNEKPSYGNSDPYWMKYSPDSLYFLYASKDNLYFVGNQKKGQDTIPIQLTTDGEPNYTFNREDEAKDYLPKPVHEVQLMDLLRGLLGLPFFVPSKKSFMKRRSLAIRETDYFRISQHDFRQTGMRPLYRPFTVTVLL